MYCENGIRIIEPVIGRRIAERHLLSISSSISEIGEFFERIHVALCKRRQLLAGELALFPILKPLSNEGREHVIESPGVAHACNAAICVDHFGPHGYPNVWVCVRGDRASDQAAKADRQNASKEVHTCQTYYQLRQSLHLIPTLALANIGVPQLFATVESCSLQLHR